MMSSKFNLYSAWIDPYFYVWAAVFAAALFCLVYALRRWLELKDAAGTEEGSPAEAAAEPDKEEVNPFLEQPAGEKTLIISPDEQQAFLRQAAAEAPAQPAAEIPAEPPAAVELPGQPEQEAPAVAVQPEEAPAAAAEPLPSAGLHEENKRAENFVRGIYAGIADLDERMKGIEAALSKSHVNNDFAVTFLEDMLLDMDGLDKAKIKARLEYLVSDLKK